MRRSTMAAILSAILLLVAGGSALAATPSPASSVPMQGQASVDQSQRQPRLLLSVDASDGSGYHLEVGLAPANARGQAGRRSRERDDEDARQGQTSSNPIGLVGQFTLTGTGIDTVTGQASGQLGTNGLGTLQFTDQSGAIKMQADFSMDNSGVLQLDLSGQIPTAAQPSAAPSTAQAIDSTATAAQPVNKTFWYVARAAGLSAYLLLFLNVVLGLAVHTRFVDAVLARWRSLDLHQFTALLAMAFMGLHALSLLGDRYIGFTFDQLLIPMASSYRPIWTAAGIVGFYLLAVVTASSYLRRFVSYRAWRALHYLSFAAFVLALVHGIYAGSDSGELWARFMYWSTGSIVALLLLRRLSGSEDRAKKQEAQTVGSRHPSGGVS